jgi:hypothetical protein
MRYILLILLMTALFPKPAKANHFKKRLAHHLANRFVYAGGIATVRPDGHRGGVAGIGDRKVGKFFDVKVGDPNPTAKRFRLEGIYR